MYNLENLEKWDLEIVSIGCSVTREESHSLRVYSRGKDEESFLPRFGQEGGLACQRHALDDSVVSKKQEEFLRT